MAYATHIRVYPPRLCVLLWLLFIYNPSPLSHFCLYLQSGCIFPKSSTIGCTSPCVYLFPHVYICLLVCICPFVCIRLLVYIHFLVCISLLIWIHLLVYIHFLVCILPLYVRIVCTKELAKPQLIRTKDLEKKGNLHTSVYTLTPDVNPPPHSQASLFKVYPSFSRVNRHLILQQH